ncbi:MAG TPA: carboxypeptidase-like regulatory domain-containing protein [Chthoniobacterales bacterium]|jgi:hypothetical protein
MNKLLRSAVVVLSGLLLLSVNVFAASATIEGVVTDDKGQALSQAQVRIEGREGSGLNQVIRTDAHGNYRFTGLSDGTFRVTLIVDGIVKASIANAMAQTGQVEKLNFSLKKAAVAKPSASGKHYVWVPSPTGSQLAGSWVEVDDKSNKKLPVGMKDRMDWNANATIRHIQSNAGAARQF